MQVRHKKCHIQQHPCLTRLLLPTDTRGLLSVQLPTSSPFSTITGSSNSASGSGRADFYAPRPPWRRWRQTASEGNFWASLLSHSEPSSVPAMKQAEPVCVRVCACDPLTRFPAMDGFKVSLSLTSVRVFTSQLPFCVYVTGQLWFQPPHSQLSPSGAQRESDQFSKQTRAHTSTTVWPWGRGDGEEVAQGRVDTTLTWDDWWLQPDISIIVLPCSLDNLSPRRNLAVTLHTHIFMKGGIISGLLRAN